MMRIISSLGLLALCLMSSAHALAADTQREAEMTLRKAIQEILELNYYQGLSYH